MLPIQCSTPVVAVPRCAQTHFGENQLSLGSISFSLLPTAHPVELHDQWVRASPQLSLWFTLAMGSSPSFGSCTYHLPSKSHTQHEVSREAF